MNYYVETNFFDHDGLVTSGGKGRDDFFEMMERSGFACISIPTLKVSSEISPAERLRLEISLRKAWRDSLRDLGAGDTLFVHHPPSEKFTGFAREIERVRKRGCRIVIIVFDLESYLKPYYRSIGMIKYAASISEEKSLFRIADTIIVHTERMKDLIVKMGIEPERIVPLGCLDYLCDGPLDPEDVRNRSGRTKPLVFCGNLIPGKSDFLTGFPDDLELELFGPGYEEKPRNNIRYNGTVPSSELPGRISGSFGLVWDGESAETGAGVIGEYLRYNAPHKLSMYLAGGLPVIVWDESAMAEFVIRENCGITVSSLSEIRSRIDSMSDDEYAKIVNNAIRIGNGIRSGEHMHSAFNKSLKISAELSERRALIVFTREPEAGKTKTRMMPYYSPEECEELHKCMLNDIAASVKKADADIVVCYTGGKPEFLKKVFGKSKTYIEQRGSDIGAKMENAIKDVIDAGYDSVVLIGTDIPEIRTETINASFGLLKSGDIVLGPTEDGGYYLIGMKEPYHEAFDVKLYGVSSVFTETVDSIRKSGLTVAVTDKYSDIDIPEDAAGFRARMRNNTVLRKSHTGKFLADTAKISVIVPVYNESDTIEHLMDQLRPYKDECEIIIADGCSTDDTVSKIGNEFRVINCDKGRGNQMNRGAEESCGDILFFLHCDSTLPQDFTDEIRQCMAMSEYGCFGVRFPSKNLFMLTNRIISNHRAFRRGIPFGDQGIFIDRDLFFSSGMFPEIPVMEDYEFARRLKSSGHRPARTRKRILTSDRRYGKGTKDILRTEKSMYDLRRLYRKGVSIDEINARYKDVR